MSLDELSILKVFYKQRVAYGILLADVVINQKNYDRMVAVDVARLYLKTEGEIQKIEKIINDKKG